MKKKLFLKLGLLLLSSLSLVACGQKNNSSVEDNSSKSSTSQVVSNTQNSVKEDEKTTHLPVESTVKSKQKNEDVEKNMQQDTQPKSAEKEYYDLIKDAWQKQQDYINSIDDPKVKQSVQTAKSAAVFKANELLMAHPEDTDIINTNLKKVLASE